MHPHEGPRHYLPVQFSDVLGEKKKKKKSPLSVRLLLLFQQKCHCLLSRIWIDLLRTTGSGEPGTVLKVLMAFLLSCGCRRCCSEPETLLAVAWCLTKSIMPRNAVVPHAGRNQEGSCGTWELQRLGKAKFCLVSRDVGQGVRVAGGKSILLRPVGLG